MIEIVNGNRRASIQPGSLEVWRSRGWVPAEEAEAPEPEEQQPAAQQQATSLELGAARSATPAGDVLPDGESEAAGTPSPEH